MQTNQPTNGTGAVGGPVAQAEARKLIADVAWSFGDGSPPDAELTEQGVKLVALGLEVPAVIPDLVELFRADARLRGQLGVVLEFIDLRGGAVADHLLPLLGDGDPAVAAAACRLGYFRRLGPRGGEVVRALVALFEAKRGHSGLAAKALAAMEAGDWGHAVVGALVRSIRAQPLWEAAGWHRYHLLADMAAGSASGPSIAGLLDLLRDGDPRVREGAANACRGVEAEGVVLALCQALKDSHPAVRYAAVCALRGCPKRLGGAVAPHLVEALRDSDGRVAGGAAYCLGKLPEAAAQALPALRERLGAAETAASGLTAEYQAAREQARALREQARALRRGLTQACELAERLERAMNKIAAAAGGT
jgi:HEAT repeat protein